jgi:hypothetical protein
VHTIAASYPGSDGSFVASGNTTILTVSKSPVAVATPASQPLQVNNGQTAAVPITVTGPYRSFAVPTGSIGYNLLNQTQTSVASGTLALTPASGYSTASVALASSLANGPYSLSISYVGDSNYAVSSTPVTILVSIGLAPSTTVTLTAQ